MRNPADAMKVSSSTYRTSFPGFVASTRSTTTRTSGAAPASSSPTSTTQPEFPLVYDFSSMGMGPFSILIYSRRLSIVRRDEHDQRTRPDSNVFLVAQARESSFSFKNVLRRGHSRVDGNTPRAPRSRGRKRERQRFPVHVHGNVN